jgi:RNA polymerase sigma-70 factor (ECF subfamily)
MNSVHSFTKPLQALVGKAPAQTQQAADPDWVYVQQVQAGDVAAFDPLFKKYSRPLLSVVYHLTSNREDAADIVQEAAIKALRSIQRFKGYSNFYTWLYRITLNETYSYLRRNRLRRFFSLEGLTQEAAELPWVRALLADTSTQASGAEAFFLNDLQLRLNQAMQRLSAKHRTVVVLHEIQGLPLEEVAKILETSPGTVRSRLHYAKQELQKYLKDYVN